MTDLKPETNYVFLVRAENSHGLSLPGPLSDVVQTTNVNQHTVPQVELTRARDRLNSEILHLKEVLPLSSTSVKITWDVSRPFLSIFDLSSVTIERKIFCYIEIILQVSEHLESEYLMLYKIFLHFEIARFDLNVSPFISYLFLWLA